MKRLFSTPILLSASACSGIELDPFRGGYELPGGPALGLRDIDYDCGPGLAVDGCPYRFGSGTELGLYDPPTAENLHDPAPVNANVGRAAAQSILPEYR